MRIVRSNELQYVAAGHEDAVNPGVWKKVLFQKLDLQPGRVQMVNWAKLPAGNQFAAHYHEDMQEIFIMISGVAQIEVNGAKATLRRGDSVHIEAREVHRMWNDGDEDAEYVAMGIAGGADGRTVIVGE